MANTITPDELKALRKSQEQPTVSHVRRKSDYETAPEKMEGASWVDPEKVDEWIHSIPADTSLVVYCVKGGSVSQSVAARLEQNHPNVRFLEGGLKAWVESGEPLE